MSLSQGGVSPREPPSNASLCARVTTLLVRQGSGSAAVPQTVRPRARSSFRKPESSCPADRQAFTVPPLRLPPAQTSPPRSYDARGSSSPAGKRQLGAQELQVSHPPRCAPAPAPLVRTPASSRAGSSTDAGALAFPALPRPADRPPRAPPRGPPTSLAPRSPPAAQVRRPEAHPARRRSLRPLACAGQSSCPCAGLPRLGGPAAGFGWACACELCAPGAHPLALQPAPSASTVAGRLACASLCWHARLAAGAGGAPRQAAGVWCG